MKKTLSIAMLVTMVCGAAMAQALVKAPGRATSSPAAQPLAPDVNRFGGNLEMNVCTQCFFDEVHGGYYVWGTNNCEAPGTTQWIAVPFISKGTGVTHGISAGIELDPACTSAGNQVTLGIYSDDCTTGPGVLIASGVARVAPVGCTLARARVAASLTAGTRYWVGATTDASPQQDNLSSIWYASNQAQIGGNVANGGWFFFSGFVPSFSVD
jgi:hypothetical protein